MQIAIELFQSEKNRYERLLSSVKNEIKNLTPPPHAAWIQTIPREIDEPLILGLLHETLYLTKCINYLRTGLDGVEKDFDLTIELEGYTKADIPDLELNGITILYGVVPHKPAGSTGQQAKKTTTHRQKDDQLKLMCRKLADLIQQDASIVRRAKDHIDRLLMEDQGTAAWDLMQWRNILDAYSIQRLVRFVMSSSERAKRLRQSNPFFAILSTDKWSKLTAELGEQVRRAINSSVRAGQPVMSQMRLSCKNAALKQYWGDFRMRRQVCVPPSRSKFNRRINLKPLMSM